MTDLLRRNTLLCLLGYACLSTALAQDPGKKNTPPIEVSSQARKLYEEHKASLVQVRILVAGTESQASAGSGFLVGDKGLIISNYHVIEQLVHEPNRYRAELMRTDQQKAAVKVLAIDVINDLALLKTDADKPWSPLKLASDQSLKQGDKVFSLGNPLDLGFAITEGTYNGLPERALYPRLLFTGAMNPGVSGGPALDASGQVVGVNVAGYGRSAELTNFQVPISFVKALITKGQALQDTPADSLMKELKQQLLSHQAFMLAQIPSTNWSTQSLGAYEIPIMPEKLARCWGSASAPEIKKYAFETARCSVDSALYIDRQTSIGSMSSVHEASVSTSLGPARFARQREMSLSNERGIVQPQNKHKTASLCKENYVHTAHLPIRAIICVRAYKKYEPLVDLSLVAQTMESDTEGLESKLFLNGVTMENGLAHIERFLAAIKKNKRKAKE